MNGEFYSILFIFVFVPEVHPLAPIIGIPNREIYLGPKARIGINWNSAS